MRAKVIVVVWAVFAVFLFASGAVAQDGKLGEELLEGFFADRRTEMEKSADDPGRMKAYVLSQKNVNVRDKKGRTLLHYAANKGYLPVVELLVQKGAMVNARDNDERTPLHEAMSYQAYDAAKLLVKNGADMTLKDKDGATPLYSIVFVDDKQRAVELLNFFMENGFDVSTSADPNLLSESIARGHRDIALILLKQGVRLDDASLFAAAREGYEDVFVMLLSKGVSPKQKGILRVACESGSLAIVKTLVEKGEEPTDRDVDSALYRGHIEAAVYLNDALKKAGKQAVDIRGRCDLKPASGRCKALFFRGYYDPAANSCREFVYGGCGGEVPFHSVEACRNVCEDPPGKKAPRAVGGQ
jgi:ankyrin repeat protein